MLTRPSRSPKATRWMIKALPTTVHLPFIDLQSKEDNCHPKEVLPPSYADLRYLQW